MALFFLSHAYENTTYSPLSISHTLHSIYATILKYKVCFRKLCLYRMFFKKIHFITKTLLRNDDI